jgi:sulfite exporter TauE/SafE
MQTEATLAAAFLVGLFGSLHCIGMCGGIVGALTLGLSEDARRSPWRLFPYLLGYNAGRITSYAFAGGLLGLLGQQLAGLAIQGGAPVGKWIAGAFMILLGLYLAGWWRGLAVLEKGGARIWRHIEPLGRRFLPVRHPVHAYLVGLVWGWLPCGMVYAALSWSLISASAVQGSLLMLAFGLGTLPMLFVMGSAAGWLARLVKHPLLRQAAGTLIIAFGIYFLFAPGAHHDHNSGQPNDSSPHEHGAARQLPNHSQHSHH